MSLIYLSTFRLFSIICCVVSVIKLADTMTAEVIKSLSSLMYQKRSENMNQGTKLSEKSKLENEFISNFVLQLSIHHLEPSGLNKF